MFYNKSLYKNRPKSSLLWAPENHNFFLFLFSKSEEPVQTFTQLKGKPKLYHINQMI